MTCKVNADTTNGLKLTSDTSGEIDLQTNGTTKVHMDSSGNVGIGTSSPSTNLHISDTGAVNRNNLVFSTPNDGTNYNALVGGNLVVDASGTYTTPATNISGSGIEFSSANNLNGHGYIRFLSAPDTNSESSTPVERMRINSSGNVGIGTTSPTGKFTVKQTAFGATNTLFDSSHGTTPQGIIIDFSSASPDNNSQSFLVCRDSTTDRLKIHSDGDIDNHDNSYSGFSDVRLKEQITDSGSQWEDIKNLRVRKFKFKQDVSEKGDSDDLLRIGVIAQELESSGMGGLVSTKPEILWTDEDELPVDDDGNPTVSVGDVKSEEIKSVKYSILYMKAVKALQEAMDRIETLEAKVTALENN